ncbi:Clan CA, family C19, ubiquitin hydrolase-like cysteine peptidase [Trichomonas vaginalis G3]|uniref:ubiquitinyl hydrolase 1 n=1 Tax=Trichomonas vaginalis (strain ATCC PRA-98 / G3) TaxID=412133 RepID=A2DF47_TRIV3|nr:ubiquitinyl hydrolase protein [Trichomonas vaginalis G3]EAY21039.1 Clan CA, family C19, ubiquitin hydrolase-like cysteine peptidase [Trichomonas vaginalis G3]KAI5519215.1 ubiquitinyl hydrolase protein [Trichomonas vaginalis G3]|eukprot:XP_001582025.1 Clan CA, family C19, ubiquitin hydrolase-like cysteine peptidase [Trichomonas vaginalis G3]
MRHLGKNPQWVEISKVIEYPPEVLEFYSQHLIEQTLKFEKEFANTLNDQTYNLKPISLPPNGLLNKGLMCFANASLQLLFSSKEFVSFILFMKNNMRFFSIAQLASAPTWSALCKFARSYATEKNIISTESMDEFFGPFTSKRHPLTMEDAAEFTMFLLNKLHDELQELIKLGDIKQDAGGWQAKGIKSGRITVSDECVKRSPITHIFGTIVRADTLSNGHSRSVGHEPYLVLPLDLSPTLEESIENFLKFSDVDDGTSKKNSFLSLPSSIVIALKRFAFDGTGVIKRDDIIKYPSKLRLLKTDFELAAIVIHIGSSPASGHYICISKRTDGHWREYDDSDVYGIRDGTEMEQQAYLLLYNRV